MSWLDLVGWLGSALLIYSVMQTRLLRFRVFNLAACLVLTGFNIALEIWPLVAMNIALSLINLWHIRNLLASAHDEAAFTVLEVGPDDDYLRHVLRVHEADILQYQPGLAPENWHRDHAADGSVAFLVLRGDETVGVVLVRDAGDGIAEVLLDYVTPRFRDFSPGEFVWRRSGALQEHGFTRVITPKGMVAPYYARIGFTARPDGSYERDL